MTTDTEPPDDAPVTVGVGAVDLAAFGSFTTADGEVLIYRRSAEHGWIQSDAAVSLERLR